MEEPKVRYRIPPCGADDIAGMERWLEDMAAAGLHLAKDGFLWGTAAFEVGAPRQERFRLEATTTNGGLLSEEYDPTQKAVELAEELGWTYRARRGQFHIYSTADPHAPELNTDPQVQAMSLAALVRYLRKAFLDSLFALLLHALLWLSHALISAAVAFGAVPVAVAMVLLGWWMVRSILRLVRLSRLCRQLQAGIPLENRADYRRRPYRHLVGKGVRFLMGLYLLVVLLTAWSQDLTGEPNTKLKGYQGTFPFATIQDYYPDAQVKTVNSFNDSQFKTWSTLLAPENYDYRQYAEVTQDGSTSSMVLYVDYYRTCHEWVAAGLVRELAFQVQGSLGERLGNRIFGGDSVELREFDLPGADYAATFSRAHFPYALLQKGDTVLMIELTVLGDGEGLGIESAAQIALSHLR